MKIPNQLSYFVTLSTDISANNWSDQKIVSYVSLPFTKWFSSGGPLITEDTERHPILVGILKGGGIDCSRSNLYQSFVFQKWQLYINWPPLKNCRFMFKFILIYHTHFNVQFFERKLYRYKFAPGLVRRIINQLSQEDGCVYPTLLIGSTRLFSMKWCQVREIIYQK